MLKFKKLIICKKKYLKMNSNEFVIKSFLVLIIVKILTARNVRFLFIPETATTNDFLNSPVISCNFFMIWAI